jgi:DNA mismatch endonuclease (patch repair protein)
MTDNLTKEARSRVMAATKGRGNQSTELKLVLALRRLGIRGWRRHLRVPGRPDFAFRKHRLAIFVDGCFWHGCPAHCRMPQSNAAYWKRKIDGNILRDKELKRRLKLQGWRTLRFWEHELKANPLACARKIRDQLSLKMRPVGLRKEGAAARPATATYRASVLRSS